MKHLLSILLLFSMTVVNAQTILKGDMNDDKDVNIADVTSLVDVVLGKAPKETIGIGSPYMVDNSYVVGTWYAEDGTSFTLNEDGTTDYPNATTYKFRPYQGTLMMFNASGKPIKTMMLNEVEKTYLLANNYGGAYFYYINSTSLVTNLTISESTLSMNSGTTAQLSVIATPVDAFNPHVRWSSSDKNIATVDQNGLVTALVGGTVTITATATDGSGVSTSCTITVIQMVTGITLSQTLFMLGVEGSRKLSAKVLPENASNMGVIWSSSDESVAQVTSVGEVLAKGEGQCVITCASTDGSDVKATCEVMIRNMENFYVDLGLPSGTLWAICNVGASNPEDNGDYFAWGETVPYEENGKNYFGWNTYKWCYGSSSTITKYCTDSSYGNDGFIDNKTELDLEDDPAYVNWGPAWHMPSKEQFEELINNTNTTTDWITQNGMNGLLITSKANGRTIFLPAAGCYSSYSPDEIGSNGRYWLRTLYERWPFSAWSLDFKLDDTSTYHDSRCNGRSVRPVRFP